MNTELALRAIRLKNRRDRKIRALIDGVFADEDLMVVVDEALAEKYGEDPAMASSFTDFLEWLFAHQEEIIAFIQAIIALFSDSTGL